MLRVCAGISQEDGADPQQAVPPADRLIASPQHSAAEVAEQAAQFQRFLEEVLTVLAEWVQQRAWVGVGAGPVHCSTLLATMT